MRNSTIHLALSGLFALASIPCPAQSFPEPKFAITGIAGRWNRADSVLIGRVTNVTPAGRQEISDPPWPLSASLKELYWCRADFTALAAVKGKLPAPSKRLLWAVIRPDCNLYVDAEPEGPTPPGPPITRVWFLREEGDNLRPALDGGVFSLPLRWKWVDAPGTDAARLFAMLLINPGTRVLDKQQYEGDLPSSAEIARAILGDEEAAASLKGLAAANPDFRQSICFYLEHESLGTCP